MAAHSHTKPLPPATPPRTAFLTVNAISSRLKHMTMQRKDTTAPESPKENHANAPPSQSISSVFISASSSGSSSGSSSSPGSSSGNVASFFGIVSSSTGSPSGFVASSSGSAPPPPPPPSSSSTGFVSASSSGSESPPRLRRLASSRRGILNLLQRMMASASNAGKKRDLKGKGVEVEGEEAGEVEYILFDGEGNPAWCPGLKYKFMGNLK